MFALEFARSVARRGGPALAPLSIPASLQELVQARVAEQPPEIRRLLAVAAAAERPTPSLLAAIDTESPRLLDVAVDLGVVSVGDDGIVRFTHPLLASAAYAELPPSRRRALHAELAARRGRRRGAGAASGARLVGARRRGRGRARRSRRTCPCARCAGDGRRAREGGRPADAACRRLGGGRSRVRGCGVPRRRRSHRRCLTAARPSARNRARGPASRSRIAAPGGARARHRGRVPALDEALEHVGDEPALRARVFLG